MLSLPHAHPRWHSLVRLPLVARRLRADVFHTQYTLSPLVGRGGVTTIHDVSFLIGPEWFRPKDRFLLSRAVPASARRAANVITVSETSKAEIESLIPGTQGKVHAIPNALGEDFHPPDRAWAQKRVHEKWAMDRPYALTVGTRWPRKNMQLAVEAVLASRSGLDLAITGKPGWGPETMHERIVRVGYVSREDLACLYAGASLYLAPSRHEGFGIPLLEAWAAGTPVICSSGGALPEVAGDAAIIMDSWKPESWAQAIDEALADSGKLETLRERGRQRLDHFDWDRTARETLRIYEQSAR